MDLCIRYRRKVLGWKSMLVPESLPPPRRAWRIRNRRVRRHQRCPRLPTSSSKFTSTDVCIRTHIHGHTRAYRHQPQSSPPVCTKGLAIRRYSIIRTRNRKRVRPMRDRRRREFSVDIQVDIYIRKGRSGRRMRVRRWGWRQGWCGGRELELGRWCT